MMKIANMQMAIRKISTILLITTLASSLISCAPSQQQQQLSNGANANQKQSSSSSPSASASAQGPVTISSTAAGTTTIAAPIAAAAAATGHSINNGQRQLSSLASEFNALPSAAGQSSAEMDTFDGNNPFTDDSLWQIPIHFERETSSVISPINPTSNDNMAKSASELTASADEHDDELGDGDSVAIGSILEHQLQQQQQPRPSAPSAPAMISASTAAASDLKTAAGYHHATPHHYGHESHHHGSGHYGAGHHDTGYHGGHHGDHYGKYFQYASVPYPYAWDFGYRRGNPYHTIERYEHGKGPHFQTKVKWSDKHGGYGVHVWDYNHDDHSKHHYGGEHHGHHYDSHAPAHYGSHHHGHH